MLMYTVQRIYKKNDLIISYFIAIYSENVRIKPYLLHESLLACSLHLSHVC